MAKAILIDSAAREVREVEVSGLEDIQKAVGGYIEAAFYHPKGDVLFVDEEGLLKAQGHFFRYAPRVDPQPLGGNGIIIGAEQYDGGGEYTGNADVSLSLLTVQTLVQFLSRDQADAWGKANASEPSSAISFQAFAVFGTPPGGRTEPLSVHNTRAEAEAALEPAKLARPGWLLAVMPVMTREVTGHMGELFARMPKPESE